MAKIEDFFTLTNSVEGIDDEHYRRLEPMTERSRCFMSYDFYIVNDADCYLVNHKITSSRHTSVHCLSAWVCVASPKR